MSLAKHYLSYVYWPGILLACCASIQWAMREGISHHLIPVIAVMPWVFLLFGLERWDPEKKENVPLEQPIWIDFAHYMIAVNFGSWVTITLANYLGSFLRAQFHLNPLVTWPTNWPLLLQMLLILTLSELLSYWQHRLYHVVPSLWRFHELHHVGRRLNLVVAGRFHILDVAIGTFLAALPLYVLAIPRDILTWYITLTGLLGVLQHANLRVRTPRFIDWVMCTPAVHRHHHSMDLREGNQNFGTYIMFFDHLFGTYARSEPEGPKQFGIYQKVLPTGLFKQLFEPLKNGGA